MGIAGATPAHWRRVFAGFSPVADGTRAGQADVRRLHNTPGEHDANCGDDTSAMSVQSGDWRVVASIPDGIAIFDRRGALVARSSIFVCWGRAKVLGLAMGQLVPDKELEIVVEHGSGLHLESRGFDVLKRRGTELVTVLSVELESSQDGSELQAGSAAFSGAEITYRGAGETAAKVLHWDAAAFKFAPS
jgi:hypothetical protein